MNEYLRQALKNVIQRKRNDANRLEEALANHTTGQFVYNQLSSLDMDDIMLELNIRASTEGKPELRCR